MHVKLTNNELRVTIKIMKEIRNGVNTDLLMIDIYMCFQVY